MGYRKRGNSYEVSVTYCGRRLSATVASEVEARNKATELKAQLLREYRENNGEPALPVAPVVPAAPTSWTLADAIKKTYEVRWDGDRSERYHKEQVVRLKEHFGEDTRLDAITTDAIDAFRGKMMKAKLAYSTINNRLTTLSAIFKVARERGGVNHLPAFGIKKRTRGRVRWMTEEEETEMLRRFHQLGLTDMHDWLCILVDTGMRPSETQHMTGAWCDFRTGTIQVSDSKTEAGKRGIPMTTRARAILEKRCLKHPKGSLFPIMWRNFQRAWQDAAAAMGLANEPDFVPYCLRHTFGTRLIQRGERVEVIAKLMGHAGLNQTLVYAKLSTSQFASAIAKLEKPVVEKV